MTEIRHLRLLSLILLVSAVLATVGIPLIVGAMNSSTIDLVARKSMAPTYGLLILIAAVGYIGGIGALVSSFCVKKGKDGVFRAKKSSWLGRLLAPSEGYYAGSFGEQKAGLFGVSMITGMMVMGYGWMLFLAVGIMVILLRSVIITTGAVF